MKKEAGEARLKGDREWWGLWLTSSLHPNRKVQLPPGYHLKFPRWEVGPTWLSSKCFKGNQKLPY